MNDDFNIDDYLFGEDDGYGDKDPDMDGLRDKIMKFQKTLRDDAMGEAYRFIKEVGILFWIRKDMYVKNSRKHKILWNMIEYFTKIEEYEKCAYLHKGATILDEYKDETKV